MDQPPSNTRRSGEAHTGNERSDMLDAILTAAGVAFFVLAIAYGAACGRL
jgi:hypothetical protein